MNIDAKILNKIQQTESSSTLKGSYTMIKWDLSRNAKFFSIRKSINVIHHINKLKNKNHMIICIEAEKAFNKIQHPFMIKTLQELCVEGTYLNIIITI